MEIKHQLDSAGNWGICWTAFQVLVFQLEWKGAFLGAILLLRPVISFWSLNDTEIGYPGLMLVSPPSAGGQAPVHAVFAAGDPRFSQASKGLGRYVGNYVDAIQAFFRNQHLGSHLEKWLWVISLFSKPCIRPHPVCRMSARPSVSWHSMLCFNFYGIAVMCQPRGTLQSCNSSPTWADVGAACSETFPEVDILWSCQAIPSSSTNLSKVFLPPDLNHILVITGNQYILPWKTSRAHGSVTFLY